MLFRFIFVSHFKTKKSMETVTNNPTNGLTAVTDHGKHYCDPWKPQISHQLGMLHSDIKDAEAEVRSDVKDASSDIRTDVKDAESQIKTTAMTQQIDSNNNFRALDNTLSRNAAVAAKDAQDLLYRLHDNIRNVETDMLNQSGIIQRRIDDKSLHTDDRITSFERRNDAQLSHLSLQAEKNKNEILAAMAASERRSIQDELNETRLKNERLQNSIVFGDKLNIIQSQLNSLDQVQRQTNQAINFGSGIIAPQTATANQVR